MVDLEFFLNILKFNYSESQIKWIARITQKCKKLKSIKNPQNQIIHLISDSDISQRIQKKSFKELDLMRIKYNENNPKEQIHVVLILKK